MKPVAFDEANGVLAPPGNMTDDECGKLPIHKDGVNCISCWELSGEELMEILQTKRVWLWVWGSVHPPVALTTNNPFRESEG